VTLLDTALTALSSRWHDSIIYVTCLVVTWLNSCVWHDSFIHVMWLIHMWQDSCICDHRPWLFGTPLWAPDDMMWFIYVTRLIVTWLKSRVWHDSSICDETRAYVTIDRDPSGHRTEFWVTWLDLFTCHVSLWRDSIHVCDVCDIIHVCDMTRTLKHTATNELSYVTTKQQTNWVRPPLWIM